MLPPDPSLDHRATAQEIQYFATMWLQKRSAGSPDDGQFRPGSDEERARTDAVIEIMQNVAAASDAEVSDGERGAIRDRLLNVLAAMQRMDQAETHDVAVGANLAVALGSSRRLVSGQVDPQVPVKADDTTERTRAETPPRQRLVMAAVAGGLLAAGLLAGGGIGYVLGDASDNAPAPPASTAQASVTDVGRFMTILNSLQEDWQPRLDALAKTQGEIGDCSGQVSSLDTWTRQLDAVGIHDPALESAGTRYVDALRTVAVDCDGNGPDLRRAYLAHSPLLDDAVVRATELGWSRHD